MNRNTTIVALATAPLNCAIHKIRVSGNDVYKIINKITNNLVIKKGYNIQHVKIVDGKNIIDDVILLKFVAPKSYTGENLIEIDCHGGIYVTNKIISLLIKYGCELAKPGEFTQRSYINKKINLIQAESINNLIKANNDNSLKIANIGLSSIMKEKLISLKKRIFNLIGQIEINIDYPEYDDTPIISKGRFINELKDLIKITSKIINDSKQVLPIISGINVAIIGSANAGKSTLFNSLCKEDKAIVTNIPGTTRDTLNSTINLKNITINILDTAGIRKAQNNIEKIGVDNSLKWINKADLIIFLYDVTKKVNKKLLKLLINKNYILVGNKCDLPNKKYILPNSIKISAKNNNINPLINAIEKKIMKVNINNEAIFLPSQHSISIMEKINILLIKILDIYEENKIIDIICEYLHEVLNNILELIGETKNFNFIDELFKNFCIGK